MDILFFLLTFPVAIPMHYLIRSDWFDKVASYLPYQPRLLHWIIASWGGLFWLPCPLCSRNFGGHEYGGSLMENAFSGYAVCPKCSVEAKRINEAKLRAGFFYMLLVILVVLPLGGMLIHGSRSLEVKKERACCVETGIPVTGLVDLEGNPVDNGEEKLVGTK